MVLMLSSSAFFVRSSSAPRNGAIGFIDWLDAKRAMLFLRRDLVVHVAEDLPRTVYLLLPHKQVLAAEMDLFPVPRHVLFAPWNQPQLQPDSLGLSAIISQHFILGP